MNPIARSWLEALALVTLQEPVKVETMDTPGLAGGAGRDASGWVIRLNNTLSGAQALETWAHELGHLCLGHVPRDQISSAPPAPGSFKDILVKARAVTAEPAADAWAADYLARLGPQVRRLTEVLLE